MFIFVDDLVVVEIYALLGREGEISYEGDGSDQRA